MAIDFGVGDLISANASPLSFFMWLKTMQSSSNTGILGKHEATGSNDGFTLFMNNTPGKLSLQAKVATEVFPFVTGTTTINDDVWHAIGLNVNYGGAQVQEVYVDAALEFNPTANQPWGTTSNAPRLASMSDSFWDKFVGQMAEIAWWSDRRSAAEMAALAKGFSPRNISPQTLLLYVPGVRQVQDLRGNALTTSGLSVATHPRVY